MSYATLAVMYPKSSTLVTSIVVRIVSYTMVGIGCVYMIMGVLCLKGLAEQGKMHYDEKVAAEMQRRRALEV